MRYATLAEQYSAYMFPGWKNYPASARILANLSHGCMIVFSGRRILFPSWEPCSVGTGSLSAAGGSLLLAPAGAESHFARVMKLLVWIHMKMPGNQISGYASFWHLEAPCWCLQNFFCHNNLSSRTGISDTCVLYTQTILLINWKQVAPKY